MERVNDPILFKCIHDFFVIYLPKQRNCSEHAIRSYRNGINSFLDYIKETKGIKLSQISFSMFNRDTLGGFLESLEASGNSTSTRNQRLNCIRSFCSYAAKVEPVAVNSYNSVLLVPIKKTETKNVEYMSLSAVQAFLSVPNPTQKNGLRDQFMLLLFYDTGARVDEILNIQVCDIRSSAGSETYTVILHGKGKKIRTVPLLNKTILHMMNYCKAFHGGYDSNSTDYLFYSIRNGVKIKMSDDNVRKLMKKYAAEAHKICKDVPLEVHPHLWRHTRAMHLYQSGMDLTMISQWLGHSRLDTTLIYAHADTEQKRQAIERAMQNNNPISELIDAERYTVSDDTILRKLYGLS